MKYERFEDLPVWQAAVELGLRVFGLTEDRAFATSGGITDQIRRAALSVANNIAEGFERGTTSELITFLYIARGSAGELRSMLRLLGRWPRAQHLESELDALISLSESCSRQMRGWADSLQNSEIAGQRHLNDQVRVVAARRKSTDAFLARLEAVRHEGRGETDERTTQARSLG